jgi:pimeloyl-ACP methyl ester carboxylesterase
MGDLNVRTSEKGWFGKLARAYRERSPILVIDDANVGIDPSADSLVSIGLKAGLSPEEWTAVGVSIGLSAAGIVMVVLAFLDPEPTSKLGLVVVSAVCVFSGGLSAVRILTKLRPPSVEVSPRGIRISWE